MKYGCTNITSVFGTLMILFLFVFTSCRDLSKNTKVKVVDPIRHYYAIVQGEELKIVYELKNVGKYTLQIEDVLPSCGCIIVNEIRNIVDPGESIFLRMTYNSNKNIGLVNHQIYVYGNIAGIEKDLPLELNFDVHVVPDGDYVKDYEVRHKEAVENDEEQDKEGVDNDGKGKGYYTKIENK